MIFLNKGYLCADGTFPPYIDSTNYLTHRFVYGRGSVVGCLYRAGDLLPSAIYIDIKFLEDKSPIIIQEEPKPAPKEEPKPAPIQKHSSEYLDGLGDLFGSIDFDEDIFKRRANRRTRPQTRHIVVEIKMYRVDLVLYRGEVYAAKFSELGTKRKRYNSVERFFADFADDFCPRPHNLVYSHTNQIRSYRYYMQQMQIINEVLDKCRGVCNDCGYF